MLQIRPMLLRVFFPQIAPIAIRLCHNSPPLQITHVTNHPHVEGLIAISPYTGVIRTFANIRVNTQKRHHGHGMGSFAHIVGAICKSPILQITHVTIRPHVEGLIAISPYTCVIRTFANIPVNTQKRHHGHGMGSFVHVVGAICKSPTLQFTHIPNCPHVGGLIAISPYTCVF